MLFSNHIILDEFDMFLFSQLNKYLQVRIFYLLIYFTLLPKLTERGRTPRTSQMSILIPDVIEQIEIAPISKLLKFV